MSEQEFCEITLFLRWFGVKTAVSISGSIVPLQGVQRCLGRDDGMKKITTIYPIPETPHAINFYCMTLTPYHLPSFMFPIIVFVAGLIMRHSTAKKDEPGVSIVCPAQDARRGKLSVAKQELS